MKFRVRQNRETVVGMWHTFARAMAQANADAKENPGVFYSVEKRVKTPRLFGERGWHEVYGVNTGVRASTSKQTAGCSFARAVHPLAGLSLHEVTAPLEGGGGERPVEAQQGGGERACPADASCAPFPGGVAPPLPLIGGVLDT